MPLTHRIHDQFQASIQVLTDAAEFLAEPIGQAARTMTDCLMAEGKILTCGSGPSALASRHLAAILSDRLDKDRPGLAAFALGPESAAMVDDADPAQGFARQVAALGQPGDTLVAFTTYGHAPGVAEAVRVARERDMRVVVLAGGDGGRIAESLGEHDVLICAPAESASRIHEAILVTVHCLCDGIDFFLLGA
ncbi:MAG TPA: SIS domain-containing protein [Thiobacillaceae bacterium]|nr:SIS domain-containing protein [Thiobacillaceae bacterium]HNA83179.1 SIS domain-containing protein [Thiobacillaceae bacterium]HNF89444.1 SIS domain-containing protein [Thiobacillaceae bacterium]HNH89983.1 SIS domain-containing protein [Thiobacillaceae bacterium]HNI08097.1 SIS domain-containing protein [Thiobacillaceae bacterium]